MEKLWDKIKKTVIDGVTVAAEKTEEYTKLGRIKIEILNTKRKISVQFTELGGIVYEAVKEGTAGEVIDSEKVAGLVETVRKLEGELENHECRFEELQKKPAVDEEPADE